MQKLLKKLKRRSPRELAMRFWQQVCIGGERIMVGPLGGLSASFSKRMPTALSSYSEFKDHPPHPFFRGLTAPTSAKILLGRHLSPEAIAHLIESADQIAGGTVNVFGHAVPATAWHVEPVRKLTVPLRHWSKIDYLNPDVAGDKKFIWELNRHQQFIVLGRAYVLTQDERYAIAFVEQLSDWIEKNPWKKGINWVSSLELGYRLISWLWALQFFRASPSVSAAVYDRTISSIAQQADHIERYLSTYFSPNTHLTGEALSLYYVGTLLPQLPGAARWQKTGRRILMEQLPAQIRSDGTYFEQTTYYHKYTADIYMHAYLLEKSSGLTDPEVEKRLLALLDHMMFITAPDGSTPRFGDDDGGTLLPLETCSSSDFRGALSLAAALFGRPDYKFVSARLSEQVIWMLGSSGVSDFLSVEAAPPLTTSRGFPEGGYYAMRSDWSPKAHFTLIDAGPHGALSFGHSHADALSFELHASGVPRIVDPGTLTYTGSSHLRELLRSSMSHNTLSVDGCSSSSPNGTFGWSDVANSRVTAWYTGRCFDYFAGEHDGYSRLPGPALHRRSIFFLKDGLWIVRDRTHSEQEHAFELHYHFATGSIVQSFEQGMREINRAAGVADLNMAFFAAVVPVVASGIVSTSYGTAEVAPTIQLTMHSRGIDVVALLACSSKRSGTWQEVTAHGGRVMRLLDPASSNTEFLVLSDGMTVNSSDVQLIGAVAWILVSEDCGAMEMCFHSVSRITLRGEVLLRAPKPISGSVRWTAAALLVEVDPGSTAMVALRKKKVVTFDGCDINITDEDWFVVPETTQLA